GDPGEPPTLERLRRHVPDPVRGNPVHRDELPRTDPDGSIEPNRRVLREPPPEVGSLRRGARQEDVEDRHHAELLAHLPAEAALPSVPDLLRRLDHRPDGDDGCGPPRDVAP